MDTKDDYYYLLGRHQAVLEQIEGIPKARPTMLSPEHARDWLQGYNEMLEVIQWKRQPVTLQSNSNNKVA